MTDSKKTNIYIPLILLLLGSFLLFSLWSAFQAAGLGSDVTDDDYYSKGLKYNTTLVEKRAAAVLGWELSTHLVGKNLELYLVDKDGGAVQGAVGSLYLAIPGQAENVRLPIRELSSGNYRIELNAGFSGAIQARLELVREGARLNRQLLLNL